MTTEAAVAARWPHARLLGDLPRGSNGAILYPRTCETCGARFGARKSKPGRFCSKRCRNINNGKISTNRIEYQSGARHPQWRGGREARRARSRASWKTSEAVRLANRAHRKVREAIAAGTIQRLACEACGATERVDAHHDDYSKPLDVVWLCRKHHVERHKLAELHRSRLAGTPGAGWLA